MTNNGWYAIKLKQTKPLMPGLLWPGVLVPVNGSNKFVKKYSHYIGLLNTNTPVNLIFVSFLSTLLFFFLLLLLLFTWNNIIAGKLLVLDKNI